MRSLTLFAYNADEFLREVSKKGTASDIQFHERKTDEVIMTLISPLRYPEKISSLTDSIYPSDVALVNVTTLNRELGEVIVALDLMGPDTGYISVSDPSIREQVKPFLQGTRLEKYELSGKPPMELVADIEKTQTSKKDGKTVVMIDHFFDVRSVGTVALGFVLQGTVRKHQALKASYIDKDVQVKSIQMHDVDVDEAGPGARVGLSLKGVDVGQLERGMILSEEEVPYCDNTTASVQVHKSVKHVPEGQFELFVSDMMRYQRGFFDGRNLELDRKIAYRSRNLVVSNNSLVPRVFGKLII